MSYKLYTLEPLGNASAPFGIKDGRGWGTYGLGFVHRDGKLRMVGPNGLLPPPPAPSLGDTMSYASDGTQHSRGIGAVASFDLGDDVSVGPARARQAGAVIGSARQIGARVRPTRVSVVAGKPRKKLVYGVNTPFPTSTPTPGQKRTGALVRYGVSPGRTAPPPVMTAPAPPPPPPPARAAPAPSVAPSVQIGSGIGQPSHVDPLQIVGQTLRPPKPKFPVGLVVAGGGVAIAAYLLLRRK